MATNDAPLNVAASRGLSLALGQAPQAQGVVFQDDFDGQADWDSGLPANDLGGIPNGLPDTTQRTTTGHTLPNGWQYVYQNPTLAPSLGDTDKREVIEIKAADSALARGGTGKCVLFQRVADSESGSWTSDGQLVRVFDTGFSEIYVEFWIRFQPNWTGGTIADSSKIFRVEHWNGQEPISKAFDDGNLGPIFVWNWLQNSYGVRDTLAIRGGPQPGAVGNYYLTDAQKGSFVSSGSYNFTDMIQGMGVGGTNPQLTDKLNGGPLPTSGLIWHEQIFGTGDSYTKMAFYLKMSSAPGVGDGVLKQWLDDERIINITDITFVPSLPEGVTEMPKWNLVGFGGNDWFKSYSGASRVQEWYAIDDIVIRDSLPEGFE